MTSGGIEVSASPRCSSVAGDRSDAGRDGGEEDGEVEPGVRRPDPPERVSEREPEDGPVTRCEGCAWVAGPNDAEAAAGGAAKTKKDEDVEEEEEEEEEDAGGAAVVDAARDHGAEACR